MPKGNDKEKKGKGGHKDAAVVGDMALRGQPEFIQGKIFGPFETACQVDGKGKLIQVYDPKTWPGSPAYWEYEDEENPGFSHVPAGCKVRVVKALVAFIPLASQASP